MNDGYEYIYSMDDFYSRALKVNKSIRITTVKPAGTTGIVFDASPGIHYPYAPYYIRRVRLQSNSTLLKVLQYAGLPMEEDKYSANTHVVSFPIKQDVSKSVKNVSVHDQLQMAKLAQSAWSDNGVSVTITFNPNEVGASDIASYLDEYQYHLKSVSFLPEVDGGAYAQMPYEEITKQKYDKLVRDIDYGIFNNLAKYMSVMDKQTDEFCNAGVCEVK
jgi:ribonucleotide reductase alpha subunit